MMKKRLLVGILMSFILAGLAYSQETELVFSISLDYGNEARSLKLVDVKVEEDIVQMPLEGVEGFKVTIFSLQGATLDSFNFNANPGTFDIKVPYFTNAARIQIYDSANARVLEIPIVSQDDTYEEDSSVVEYLTPDKLKYIVYGTPIVIVIIILIYFELHMKKGHADLQDEKKQHTINAIRDYALKNLGAGYTKEQIVNALLKGGYSIDYIEEAFSGLRMN